MPKRALVLLAAAASLAGCAPMVDTAVDAAVVATTADAQAHLFAPVEGVASWYGPGFAGRTTANGEIFDPSQLTAAHKTIPFDTRVRVTHLATGKSVVVRINDRGPFRAGRVIDLSRAAADRLGMMRSGTARVRLEPLRVPSGVTTAAGHSELEGFDVLSSLHQPGQLLLLSSERSPDPVIVRVVGNDLPPGSGAQLLLPRELFDRFGQNVTLTIG